MLRATIISAAMLAAAATAHAGAWSLDSCIAYAVEHNLTVASHRLEQQGAELDVTEARDAYLPTVNAGASQGFDFGRGLTSENTYVSRNTRSFGWNANLSLPLFQGLQAYRREQLAKANLATLVEQTEAARDDVTLNVMAAYLQALYTGELRDVAASQVELSAKELERRKVLLDNGKIAESEVWEARAQLAADSLTLVNTENDVTMAMVDLAQLLRIDYTPAFTIMPLTDVERLVPDPSAVVARALENNHSMVAARLNIKAAERQIALAQAGYIPRLSFNLGAGSTFYHLNGEINPTFARQMRDNFSTSLGFTLSIPVFDAFSTRNNTRRARLQKARAEIDREMAADKLERDIIQAYHQAVGAGRKLATAAEAASSARVAFDAMAAKYELGAATATEYEQSKTTYIKALAEEVQARYERLLRTRILEFYNR